MTGKTHRTIGIAFASAYHLSTAPATYNPATLAAVVCGAYFGSLIPDLDKSTADIWDIIPFGHTVGKVVDPLLKHRNFSHSLLGLFVFSILFGLLTATFPDYWGINSQSLLLAFVIGYSFHLLADMFTVEGIPLFYPYKKFIGIPPKPFDGLRIITGQWFENLIIFPIISLLFTIYIIIRWDTISSILFRK